MTRLRTLQLRLTRLLRRGRNESGLTIVEVVVASVVIMTVFISLAYVMTGSLETVGCSRQRNAADQLVNQTLEQIRALPYTTVSTGDVSSDLTGDSSVTSANGVYTYTPTGETMPSTSGSSTTPIYPHKAPATTYNGTTYNLTTYVTNYASAPGAYVPGAYRVIAMASWSGGSCRTTTSVSGQTIVDQPSGVTTPCVSDSTHPYPAPCQPFFQSEASNGDPYLQISPAPGASGNAISGIALTDAELGLPTLDCTLDMEQIANGQCKGETAHALLSISGAADQTTGGDTENCSISSDPSLSPTCTAAPSQPGVSNLTASGGGNALSLAVTSGDAGNLAGDTTAGANPACDDLSGNAILNGLPCTSGSLSQSGGSLSATATLASGGYSLGSTNLASLGAATSPLKVFDTDVSSSGGSYCASTSGDGCVHAGATRSLGALALAGLPAQVSTDVGSWGCGGYLLTIANFSDTVTSESGVSAASPSAQQNGTTGLLSYWNGTSCATQTISQSAWGSTPPTITMPTTTVTDSKFGGGTVVVTMTPTITVGATSTSSSTNNCASACTASASSPSPVVADVIYVVTVGGTTVVDADIHMDLGTLKAVTSYTQKPSAS
jgi:hypothetical protein